MFRLPRCIRPGARGLALPALLGLFLPLVALASIEHGKLAHHPAPAPLEPGPPTRPYVLVLLRRGEYVLHSQAEGESLQAAHQANIHHMWEHGTLLAAGPFGDDTPLRGLFVFDADSAATLNRLMAADPLLACGRLRAERCTWRAPVGIGAGYRARAAAGRPDSMVTFTTVIMHLKQSGASAGGIAEPMASLRARWRRAGQLVLDGPLEGPGGVAEFMVFAADTATVKTLVADEPAVTAGRYTPEIHPWWTAYGTVPGH